MPRLRTALPLALIFALAACGGSGSNEGSTDVTKGNGVAVAVNGGSVECKGLPPHAPLPDDAKVTLCTHGEYRPGHIGGSVQFTTAKAPAEMIAFYKAKAAAEGLKTGLSTDSAFSAVDGTKRTMMVMPKPAEGGGSQVILNFGSDK